MSLINDLNKVVDVTAYGVRADPIAGTANLAGFNGAIAALLAAGRRGTLYVPPGHYPIDHDPLVTANWQINFSLSPGMGENRAANIIARQNNIFGASVVFRQGTTLWLAPGAVLIPARGCILDISSLLVCETTRCFDLSLGGLVVFGSAVPAVRPEWWGAVPGQDASGAIQSAVDAAIHNRNIRWPTTAALHDVRSRPPLVVELRGELWVDHTIDVRGDAASNGIVLQHSTGVPPIAPSGASVGPSDTATVIRGAWRGARRQGASLIAGKLLGQAPVLRLTYCPGITVRNIAFSTDASGYQPSVEVEVSTGVFDSVAAAAQNIAFQSCRFVGASTPLVQVGAHPVVHPPDARSALPYIDRDNEIGADLCLLSFEDCDILVLSGGVGIDVRAQNALPLRYRRCDFSGDAAAFMSLWSATHFLEGCRFENSRAPSTPKPLDRDSPRRGMELPDGSDLFLRKELSMPNGMGVVAPFQGDLLAGLTAIGCVSRSHRFLSTVRPVTDNQQDQERPVVLLNLHQIAPGTPVSPSIQWGMQSLFSGAEMGARESRPMSRGAPLLVVGGSLSSEIRVLRGSVQSAAVGVRVYRAGVLDPGPGVVLHYERAPTAPPTVRSIVFGLPVDQRL